MRVTRVGVGFRVRALWYAFGGEKILHTLESTGEAGRELGDAPV